MVTMSFGLRNGGGIGEVQRQASFAIKEYGDHVWKMYYARWFYDLTWFIVLQTVIMSIIFGLLFDAFGELREHEESVEKELKSKCFTCEISKKDLIYHGAKWQEHVKGDHNIWNYIAFIYIMEKSKIQSDFNGIESYVYSKLMKQDVSWFPIGRAKCADRG